MGSFRSTAETHRTDTRGAGGCVAASVYISQSHACAQGRQTRGVKERTTRPNLPKVAISAVARRSLYTRRLSFWYIGRRCVRANFPNRRVYEKDIRPISFSNSWRAMDFLRLKSYIRAFRSARFPPGSEMCRTKPFSRQGNHPRRHKKVIRGPTSDFPGCIRMPRRAKRKRKHEAPPRLTPDDSERQSRQRRRSSVYRTADSPRMSPAVKNVVA